ncbi:hypothetical protein HDU93_004122, partial [Gonapodya sp. JEL0774]
MSTSVHPRSPARTHPSATTSPARHLWSPFSLLATVSPGLSDLPVRHSSASSLVPLNPSASQGPRRGIPTLRVQRVPQWQQEPLPAGLGLSGHVGRDGGRERGLAFGLWTRSGVPLHLLTSMSTLSRGPCADVRRFGTAKGRANGTPVPAASSASTTAPSDSPTLTHLTPTGSLHMVDVLFKPPTYRRATARCTVYLTRHAASLLRRGALAKGDAVAVAKVAGMTAAKKTWEVVPLCHAVALGRVDVEVDVPHVSEDGEEGGVTDYLPESARVKLPSAFSDSSTATAHDLPRTVPRFPVHISCTVTAFDRTGVEMEAVHGCTVAGVVVYDMCKAADRGAVISGVRVVEKSGGKSGGWV